jgi:hypothetical protein
MPGAQGVGVTQRLPTACIDKGDNYAPALPPNDIDGEDRTVNGDGANGAEVDMGANEYDP